MTVNWEYSRSRARVRAVARGVSVVTLRAGGSCRSSTAEKRYFEEHVDDVEVLAVGTEAVAVMLVIAVGPSESEPPITDWAKSKHLLASTPCYVL